MEKVYDTSSAVEHRKSFELAYHPKLMLLSKHIGFTECSNEWSNEYFNAVYTRCLTYSCSLYRLILFAIDDRWLWTHHWLTDWQMEYGLVCCKGRPDRISHLQRPRICLRERETDTESVIWHSIGKQSLSITITRKRQQRYQYQKDISHAWL